MQDTMQLILKRTCNRCKKEYEVFDKQSEFSKKIGEQPYLLCKSCGIKRNKYLQDARKKVDDYEESINKEFLRPFEEVHIKEEKEKMGVFFQHEKLIERDDV